MSDVVIITSICMLPLALFLVALWREDCAWVRDMNAVNERRYGAAHPGPSRSARERQLGNIPVDVGIRLAASRQREEANRMLDKVAMGDRLSFDEVCKRRDLERAERKRVFNETVMPALRDATPAEVAKVARSVHDAGGTVVKSSARDGWLIATRDVVIDAPLYGSASVNIIVPRGVKAWLGHVGHNSVWFADDIALSLRRACVPFRIGPEEYALLRETAGVD